MRGARAGEGKFEQGIAPQLITRNQAENQLTRVRRDASSLRSWIGEAYFLDQVFAFCNQSGPPTPSF